MAGLMRRLEEEKKSKVLQGTMLGPVLFMFETVHDSRMHVAAILNPRMRKSGFTGYIHFGVGSSSSFRL